MHTIESFKEVIEKGCFVALSSKEYFSTLSISQLRQVEPHPKGYMKMSREQLIDAIVHRQDIEYIHSKNDNLIFLLNFVCDEGEQQ